MSVEAVNNPMIEQSAEKIGRIFGRFYRDYQDAKEVWEEFKKPIDELGQDLQKTGQEIQRIINSPAEKLPQIAISPQEAGETAEEGDFEIVSVTKSREEKEMEKMGLLATAALLASSVPMGRRAFLGTAAFSVPVLLAGCGTEQPEGDPQALSFDLREEQNPAAIAKLVFSQRDGESLGIFKTEEGLAKFIQNLPKNYPLGGKAKSLEITEDGLIVRTNAGLSYKTMILTSAGTGETDSGDAWAVLGSKPIKLNWGEKIVWYWDQDKLSWQAKYLGQNGRGGDILSEKEQVLNGEEGAEPHRLPDPIPSPTLFPTVLPTETKPLPTETKVAPTPTKTEVKPTPTKTPTPKPPTPKPMARPPATPTKEIFDIPDVFPGKAPDATTFSRWEKNWGNSNNDSWIAFGRLMKIEVKGNKLIAWIDTQNNGQAEDFIFEITADQPVLFVEPFGNYGKPDQSGGGSWQTGSALEAKAAVEKFYEVKKSAFGFRLYLRNPDQGRLKQNILWYSR